MGSAGRRRAALDEKLAAKRRTLDDIKRQKESDEGGKTTELQSKRFALSTMDETAKAKETEAAEISRRVKELEENLVMNYDTLQQKLSAATQKFNEAAADFSRGASRRRSATTARWRRSSRRSASSSSPEDEREGVQR